MEKTPTVEELINKIDDEFYEKNSYYLSISNPNLFAKTIAIEFAKLHVEETLKEAAERYWAKQPYNEDAFIDGAKWQQERMYSEEEVDKLISIIQWYDDNSDVRPDSEIFMWFEQFKKK